MSICEVYERFEPYLLAMGHREKQLQKRGSKGRKALSRLLVGLTVAIFVAAPAVLQSSVGLGISPVLSGSMAPFAEPGDIFITVERAAAKLAVGDIVTLQVADSNALYAHRIIEVSEQQGGIRRIVTKGDANPTAEENPFMASSQSLVPVTVMRVKWIGHVLVFLTSAQGRQAGLSLIVVANVLMLLLALFKKPSKKIASQGQDIFKGLYEESYEDSINEIKKKEIYRDLYTEAHWQLQTIKEK